MIFKGIVVIVLVITDYTRMEFSYKMSLSFEQRLTIVAPFLGELEEEEIRASWASMESLGDYISVCDNLETISSKYNISLPEPYLYKKVLKTYQKSKGQLVTQDR